LISGTTADPVPSVRVIRSKRVQGIQELLRLGLLIRHLLIDIGMLARIVLCLGLELHSRRRIAVWPTAVRRIKLCSELIGKARRWLRRVG
jgi:hypothetical protein